MAKDTLVDPNPEDKNVLDQIVQLIAGNRDAIDDADNNIKQLWNTAFVIFDHYYSDGCSYEGKEGILYRIVSHPAPKLDAEKLRIEFQKQWPNDHGSKMWIAVTNEAPRVLDHEKLAREVREGRVPAELVEVAMTVLPEQVGHRWSEKRPEKKAKK